MRVLDRLRNFGRRMLGVAEPTPQLPEVVQPQERARVGRWDSKDVDRMNQAHKAKVTGLPINAELAYAIGELRADCEYEISCNPIVEGMLNTYCTDVVGPKGPTYRVQSSNAEYNKLREKIWRRWWKRAGANRQLAGVDIMVGWVKSLFKAGEFGTQLITVNKAEGPVKLRLLPVHMHRLLTPPEMIGDPEVALGVRRDENRNPTHYYVSEPFIFGPFEVYTGEFNEVPYDDFIHGFRMDEEDQVRGVPWLASCLGTVEQLRDWDKAMLDAAEMLAKTGVLWQCKNPSETAIPVMKGSAPMQRGQQLFGPPGYEAEQVTPTQPSADQQSFRSSKKAECGRGFNMPLMLIELDSSKHNYSSARFDNQPYWRAVAMVQEWIGRIALDRIEYEVMREAELAGEFDGVEEPDDVEIGWGWIKPPQVDPTKEALADRTNLQNQTVSLSEAIIAQGKDPDHVLAELKRDKDRLTEAGLPTIPGIPDPSKAAGSGAQGPAGRGGQKNGGQDDQGEEEGTTKGTNDTKGGEATRSRSYRRRHRKRGREGESRDERCRAKPGDEDGHWVTIDGEHVLIKGAAADSRKTSSSGEKKSDRPLDGHSTQSRIKNEGHGAHRPEPKTDQGPKTVTHANPPTDNPQIAIQVKQKRQIVAALEKKLADIKANPLQHGGKALKDFRKMMGSASYGMPKIKKGEARQKAKEDAQQIKATLNEHRDFLASHPLSEEGEKAASLSGVSAWANKKAHEVTSGKGV